MPEKRIYMVRYVKSIDEMVDIIDKEFSGKNAVCPICKHKIGVVNIPDVELGLPVLNFMQYRDSGIFCSEGHCVICLKDEKDENLENAVLSGGCRIHITDLGVKVFEVIKIVKPYLDIDLSIPNKQIYWMLRNKEKKVLTKGMDKKDADNLINTLQKLGARAEIIM